MDRRELLQRLTEASDAQLRAMFATLRAGGDGAQFHREATKRLAGTHAHPRLAGHLRAQKAALRRTKDHRRRERMLDYWSR